MQDKLMFVQLMHPGKEHSIKSGTTWNSGRHLRKFLLSQGSYLKTPESKVQTGEILFWGEWEPPADVASISNPIANGPSLIFSPFYSALSSYESKTNTDPFVFADPFLYSCCQQTSANCQSQLSFLKPGSVLLFGSHKGGQFILDTVFVVKEGIDYHPVKAVEELEGKVPAVFRDTVLKTFLPQHSETQGNGCSGAPCSSQGGFVNRLYSGVTYEEREQFNGMFSYSPCMSYAQGSQGFARPVISPSGSLERAVTPAIRQGGKHTNVDSPAKMSLLWKEVTHQVMKADLMLGITMEAPLCRELT